MRAGIALGSNLGDRLALLREARKHLLCLHDGTGPFLCSKIYETAPLDCPQGSPAFLNAAIELSTQIPPLDLLRELQEIEITLGRPRDHEFHGPRTIDLDLLYQGNLRLSLPSLTLPHPRISERLFVLKPLSEICPDRMLSDENCSIRVLCEIIESEKENYDSLSFYSTFN